MKQFFEFIQNHLMLWSGFIIVFIAIILEEFIKNRKRANYLTPQEVVDLINHEETLVLDIRDHKAFTSGHIINSLNIPCMELEKNPQKLAAHKEKKIILVATLEQDAQNLTTKLKTKDAATYNKFAENIYILKSGISAWRTAGLPLVKKD